MKYEMLPAHMRAGAQAYIEYGIEPGGFLYAVLTNNLKEAFGRADEINLARMKDWAHWIYWCCPMEAQGSVEKVNAWIAKRGLFAGNHDR